MSLIYGMVKDNVFICSTSNSYTYKKNMYQIAYDGNIFNVSIIKQELLSKGYYFETGNEDEVIVKAFVEYGFEVYSKFSGHFSIAIWNQKELVLMRDYYSVKTLYYKQNDNGDIVFSSNLPLLLNSTDNMINYNRFVDIYVKKRSIKEGFITENIKESHQMMYYIDKDINKIESVNYSEVGYLFDEVAQVVLSNLENIYIVKLEDKNNEVRVVAEYVLDTLDKGKEFVAKVYSIKRLNWFLNNMSLPFFNLAEYNLAFINGNGLGIVDIESNNIKKFYNVDFFCNEYNMNLVLPRFCRSRILGIKEIYIKNIKKVLSDCVDEEIVNKEFETIEKWGANVSDYYKKVYFIRLDRWIKKYNIKII